MLTHHESHVLALVHKWQPTTAYFVRKMLPRSIASTFSDSPGSIYPVIERLKRAGYIEATLSVDDARSTEHLTCTEVGDGAVREWILRQSPSDDLPEDPWRTRAIFAEVLTTPERLAWLTALRDRAEAQRTEIERQKELSVDVAHSDALEHARLAIEARSVWIERLIANSLTAS